MFRGFAELAAWIAEHLRVENAALDAKNLRSAPRMAATIDRQAEGYRGALIMN